MIIKINKDKCNGCGACAKACHEGAIEMIDGVAVLTREDYCDGLGDCLPACPCDAISFEEREALGYNEEAVKLAKSKKTLGKVKMSGFNFKTTPVKNQWPVQLKLVSPNSAFFDNSHLLVAADCCAYMYSEFHNDFMKDKITLIGCTKLDSIDYTDKLKAIIDNNNIISITVVRMEVPCCSGIVKCVSDAIRLSGKNIPLEKYIISTKGTIL